MNENSEKTTAEVSENPENQAENTEATVEKEYYERQYFEGDSLKELEGDDDDDDNEFLEAFDKASKVETNVKSKTSKKQLIVLCSVFACAVIMLCLYFFVFNKSEEISEEDQYYVISANQQAELLEEFDKITSEVKISFCQTEDKLESDSYGVYIKAFAESYANCFSYITLEYGTGGDYVKISSGSNSVSYTEDDFFNTLEDGTRFSFNGDILYGKAIFEVAGNNTESKYIDMLQKWALDGYDIDGDILGSSNRPFMYPNISRSDIVTLEIRNQYGSYKIYRGQNSDGSYNSSYYFENAELCSYDQELFSSLIVNCTYVLTLGKISNPNDLADYGLADEDTATAVIQIHTVDGDYHKIIIGNEVPSSGGYYAKYYNKDFVYLLDSGYEDDVLQPVNIFLTATLGYTISSTNDVYSVSDLLIRYYKDDTDVYISKKTDVSTGNMTGANSEQTIETVLHDKTRMDSVSYTDWTSDTSYVGFTATDKTKDMYVEMQLTNYAYKTGEYKVTFGLIKDTSKKAVTPSKVTVKYYDNSTSTWIEGASLTTFEQSDKSYKQYTLSFNTELQVRYIRIYIHSSDTSCYTVLDEVTAYADGKDAIPNESVTGVWKIVSPSSFIQAGTNYAIPDTSSFSEILYGITTLVGDEVVEYDIFKGSEEETSALLDKYGLLNPNMAVSYLFDGYRTYIYVSDVMTGEDKSMYYYAYSAISFTDDSGNTVNISPNIIAKVYYDTATYLGWEAIDLLDRSAFTMYIDKIDTIEMTFGGNSYLFDLQDTDANGKMDTVIYNGNAVDTQNFRYVYVSVLECYRMGLYTPQEGDICDENLIFTFNMHSDLKDTEIKFYRVTSTKVVYCTNGEESEFYVLYSDVSTVMSNVQKLIRGEDVPK